MAKTTIVWYSATGNTLYLAKRFQNAELIYVDDIMLGEKIVPEDTERLGLLYPVYGNGIPVPMKAFIREYLAKRDNSNLGYIFAVTTNGGAPLASGWIIDRELQDIGLALSYSASVHMPDGYLPLLKSAPDKKATEEILAKAEPQIQTILKDVEKEEMKLPRRVPLAFLFRWFSNRFNHIHPVNRKMAITDSCVGCGICTKVCPMDNIIIENGAAHYGDRCISCFACYHKCPHVAIRFGKVTGQYEGLVATKELFKR